MPEPDVDEQPLIEALSAAGIEAQCCAWHDVELWHTPLPTLVRSTWDYIHRVEDFRDWMTQVAATTSLWNPAAVMVRNLHKRYLLDLAAQGVPTVPTRWLPRGSTLSLLEAASSFGSRRVVIKPAVGAGSFETHRLDLTDPAGESLLRRLVAERDALVQPYLDSVEDHGERALVWIDGAFTHAVRKSPRFADDVEQVSAALELSPVERAVGEAALAPWRGQLLYARVDVAPDAAGQPLVMELELVEPSLFLIQHPPALTRLVAALKDRLTKIAS